MTQKRRKAFYFERHVLAKLDTMSSHDLRTLSGEIEWLITNEWKRRQDVHRLLVDTAEPTYRASVHNTEYEPEPYQVHDSGLPAAERTDHVY